MDTPLYGQIQTTRYITEECSWKRYENINGLHKCKEKAMDWLYNFNTHF